MLFLVFTDCIYSAPVASCVVQCMESEFRRWMKFYGKICSKYEIVQGDFLAEEMKEKIAHAS